mmetsp:Transcript_8095/g.17702  ORF Transcript_8095/g.17702 Transcript_8095/m.17702 type:complete len:616 (+) Transcript_8095:936-2783(+)
MLYGMEFEDLMGFTEAFRDVVPLDNRGYSTIMEGCDFEKIERVPFYKYSKVATAIYYPNSPAYDTFKGYDLVPENKDNYVGGQFSTLNQKDGGQFTNHDLAMQTCRIPMQDEGAWHVQRLGPFISTGGYNWWTLAWDDVAMLSEGLKKYPEGIDVEQYMFTPVLKNGERLNYPPIHSHHVHVVTHPGVRPRLQPIPLCLGRSGLGIPSLDAAVFDLGAASCWNLTLFFEQHGDYICTPEDDGIECLTQGGGIPRRLAELKDIETEFNDVRPTGSEPLEWYFQVAMRWKSMDESKPPVSFNGYLGPPNIIPPSQLTKSGTNPTPTDEASMFSYSGTIYEDGEVVRIKAHSHSAIAESSMLMLATYADLGLDGARFTPAQSYLPLRTTSELGFESNNQLAHYILDHLSKAQARYDYSCTQKHDLRNDVCSRPRPEWKCGTLVDYEMLDVGGKMFPFDRRCKTWCKPWTFRKGDRVVAIGFNKKVLAPPSPVNPDTVPKTMQNHLGFFINLIIPGVKHGSHNAQIFTHDGTLANLQDRLSPCEFMSVGVSLFLWGGAPNSISTLVFMQYVIFLVLTSLLALLVYLGVFCFRRYSPKGAAVPHVYKPLSVTDEEGDAEL